MFNRRFLVLAAMVLGLISFTGAPASAFPAAPSAALVLDHAAPQLLQVHSRGGRVGHAPVYRHHGYNGHRYNRYNNWTHWDRRYHGPRCRGWTSYCRHYYGGWYYANPWWGMPMIGAGVVISGGGNRHVAWCEGRYRSYNARNNTWISNSGKVRQCISPYGP